MSAVPRKVVLVTRRTRLDGLIARHHTLAQARFVLEHLGDDLGDYLAEHAAQAAALEAVVAVLQRWGRWQSVERELLPNFVFAPDDIVVALGPDGIVANTLKYLDGQPLIGLNPEPARWDGVLLPFQPQDLATLLPEVARERRGVREVTLAEVELSDGQRLRAVNELYIGAASHVSALYDLECDGVRELQSSSGVIVATGLGSTAWLRSIVTGSLGVLRSLQPDAPLPSFQAEPWDTSSLTYAVREPFPSRHSGTRCVWGRVSAERPLRLRSRMPEHGVVFSDGMEADRLRFPAGMLATIRPAATRGRLVV